jgi:hypothetical protein
MGQIARGEGKAPQSFMLAKSKSKLAKPDAVWHSNKAASEEEPAPRRARARKS